MSLDEILNTKKSEILRLAGVYGVKNVRVFGSVIKGQVGLQSDIDFLVDLETGHSYLDIWAFLLDLQT